MREVNNWLVVIVLVASCTTVSTVVSQSVGYVLAILAVVICGLCLAKSGSITISGTSEVFFVVGLFIAIILGHAMVSPGLSALPRAIVFSTISPVLFFIAPEKSDWSVVFYRFSIFTGAMILLSIPTLFVDRFGPDPIAITAWHVTSTIPVLGLEHNQITGYFANPNTLSFVCLTSSVSLLRFIKTDTLSRWLFGINALGLYFAGSRAALLAFVAACGLFIVHLIIGSDEAIAMSFAGLVSVFLVVLLALAGIVPLDITGRDDLWTASAHAFLDRPLFGHGSVNIAEVISSYITDPALMGMGPHNSFIVPFLIGGLAAGLAYLWLFASSFKTSAQWAKPNRRMTIHILFVTTIIVAIFEGSTVFGISATSGISALILGYTINRPRSYHNHGPYSSN